ncbi:MAG: hypothetical protein HXX19_13700, partial [Rhodoferax sp.]|nr:hypothetical protein [Rhodoferax sp.]
MNRAVDQGLAAESGQKSSLQVLGSDTLVYLSLVLLVWGTWRISLLGLFESSDDTGYWMGVTGAVMMLLLLSYP